LRERAKLFERAHQLNVPVGRFSPKNIFAAHKALTAKVVSYRDKMPSGAIVLDRKGSPVVATGILSFSDEN
jgi:hypothetical protein